MSLSCAISNSYGTSPLFANRAFRHARRPGPLAGYRASWRVIRDLHGADCLSLRPAVALRDLEFDPLAFFEAAVAI